MGVSCISTMLKYRLKKSISGFQANRYKVNDQIMCSCQKHLTSPKVRRYWHTSSLPRLTDLLSWEYFIWVNGTLIWTCRYFINSTAVIYHLSHYMEKYAISFGRLCWVRHRYGHIVAYILCFCSVFVTCTGHILETSEMMFRIVIV